jgi:hypothetical protein
MTFPTPDEAYLVVAALAPGFIILFIRSRFVTGEMPNFKDGLFYYVFASVLYYAVSVPLFPNLAFSEGPKNLLFFLAGPVFVGMILGLSYQKQWLRGLSQQLGLSVIHSVPSAWDYAFGQTQTRPWTWIVVTTQDNEKIYGLFGSDSIASSDTDNREIYIQQVTDAAFRVPDRPHGLWIRHSEIKFVEFIPD